MEEQQLVAVIDGTRARFFAVRHRSTPSGKQKKELVELETLINPAHRMKDGELYSDSRPGLRATSARGSGHAVDDKRDAHGEEFDRRFAKLVVENMATLIRGRDVSYAIVAAGPAVLGHLREHASLLPRIEIGELPKQLTQLSPHELCDRLEADKLI